MKNTKVANINIKFKDLFTKWLYITKIFHNLTKREIEVLSLFLYKYYTLKKDITNEKILWKVLFDYDTKLEITEELDISNQSLQNILTSLRKHNIIKDNKIVKTYIPNIEEKSNNFKIIFNFNIVDNE